MKIKEVLPVLFLVALVSCSYVIGEQTNVYERQPFSAVNFSIDPNLHEDVNVSAHKIINISNSKKAKEYIANKYNISVEELTLPYDVSVEFPLTKREVWKAKIIDKDGNIYGVNIDENGSIMPNIDAIEEKEMKEYIRKYGKIEPSLWDKLEKVGENENVSIAVWLTPIDSESIEKDIILKHMNHTNITNRTNIDLHFLLVESQPSDEEIKKIKKEIFSAKKEAYNTKEMPIIEYLVNKKKNVTYSSIAAPLVFTTVPKDEIFALAKRDDVSKIFLSEGKAENLLNSAVPTIRASPVWNDDRCKSAFYAATKIGIIDINYGVAFDKLFGVNGYTQPSCSVPSDPIYNSSKHHATMMAKVLADNPPSSPYNDYKGVDQCASQTILSACGVNNAYFLMNIIVASDWALNEGADILSCSFGRNTTGVADILVWYYDHIVSEHDVVVVAAAGNKGMSPLEYVTSPALAYNVLAVGGTDDNNTRKWSDDIRWPDSCYKERYGGGGLYSHGDGNKPEVSAPAKATTVWPYNNARYYVTDEGTSISTPLVAGEIAMMMASDRSNSNKLRTWPMVDRALIMATARHDTYLGPAKGGYWSGGRLWPGDDQEGVGTIVISDAYDSVINYQDPPINVNRGYYKIVYAYDSSPYNISFLASAGEKVRFAISWDSYVPMDDPNDHIGGYLGMDTASDIDLVILDPDGVQLASSTSYDNNYEFVEFVAPKNSTYQIGKMYTAQLQFYRFNPYKSYEEIGVAWSRKPFLFKGNVGYLQDSFKHAFNVYSGSDVYVNLSMPLTANFDLSVWDNLNRRTGGRTSTDYTIRTEIPGSTYSGYSANPEWVNILPSATTGTWKTGCFAYSGYGNYNITVDLQ